MISSDVKIWYPHMWRYDVLTCEDIIFDKISLLSLQVHLNLLVYDRNIFGSSSAILAIFGNLQKIFRNVREMSRNICLAFRTILETLRKSSESDRKSLENRQKRHHQHIYIIKRTLHVSSKIWILCSCGKNYISLIRCTHSWDLFYFSVWIKVE